MKRTRIYFAALLLGAMTLSLNSCVKDPCENVVCQNGGTSEADGDACNCTCEIGYEGDRCQTEVRSKFMGNYLANGTDNQGGTYTNWTVILSNSSTGVTKFLINLQTAGITLTATLNSEGTGYTIDGTSVGGFTYSGSGTLTSSTMTLTMTETDGVGSSVIYNFTGTKQ